MNQTHTPASHAAELPAVPNPFDAGVELYNTPRIENEVNLIKQVRDVFLDNGVAEETLAIKYDGSRHIKAAQDKNSVVQRVHVNRFLNLSLVSSRISTVDLRHELLPNGSVANWLKVVENKVVPFIAKNNLLAA